jgi:hypothetical protein
MAMPDFIANVQFVANILRSPADDQYRRDVADMWLTPATVADFSESDFVALPSGQRTQLRDAVAQFRSVAERGASATPVEVEAALAAFDTILTILEPYIASPESERVREAIWSVWKEERWWIPTFDYEIGDDSTGDPAVWIWLILNDDRDIEARETREWLRRVRLAIRSALQDRGVERWPYISVRSRSETKELMARATA